MGNSQSAQISQKPLTMLDQFAGIGGATIAGDQLGIKTTQFIEIDPDAQAVLRYRYPDVPIHSDIRDYHPKRGEHDIHWSSFPCTGTSQAGKRNGLNHPESGLWIESLRCAIEGRPEFIVIENPEGLIHRGLRAVLGGLRVGGYVWDNPQLVSASWFGAPHRRNRLFITAYTNELRGKFRELPASWEQQIRESIEAVANAYGAGRKGADQDTQRVTDRADPKVPDGVRQNASSSPGLDDGVPEWLGGGGFDGWWRENPPPKYPGVPARTPGRRACIKLYGRSVVPQQAAIALRRVIYLNSLLD